MNVGSDAGSARQRGNRSPGPLGQIRAAALEPQERMLRRGETDDDPDGFGHLRTLSRSTTICPQQTFGVKRRVAILGLAFALC